MKILQHYLGMTVLRAMLLITLLLFGINFFMQFLGEINSIGSGDFGIINALLYVIMQMPQMMYQYFPICALIGSLVGLGQLATKNELIAAQSSGMSITAVTYAVLKYSMLLLVVMVLLGEVLAPKLRPISNSLHQAWLHKKSTDSISGVWLTSGNQFLHFDTMLSDKKLYGVTLFKFKGTKLQSAEYAPTADKVGSGTWMLKNLRRTVFSATNTTVQNIGSEKINYKINITALQKTSSFVDNVDLVALRQQVNYLKSVGLSVRRLQYSFWQRIFAPVISILMVCIAIPFVFGSMRSASMSVRIIAGLMFGFAFFILNQVIGTISLALQAPPIIAAGLPLVAVAAIYIRMLTKL